METVVCCIQLFPLFAVINMVKSDQAAVGFFSSENSVVPFTIVHSESTNPIAGVGMAAVAGGYTYILRFDTYTGQHYRIHPGQKMAFHPAITFEGVWRENKTCDWRYLGLSDEDTQYPDSIWSAFNPRHTSPDPWRARLTHPNGWLAVNFPCWVQIDFGTPHIVYRVATKGGSDGNGGKLWSSFKIHYGDNSSSLTTFTENSSPKVFISIPNNANLFNTIFIVDIGQGIVGSVFRFEGVSGTDSPAFRVELYGCALLTNDTKAMARDPSNPYNGEIEIPEIIDNNVDTCITVNPGIPVVFFIPMIDYVGNQTTVTTKSKQNPNCETYGSREFSVMTKDYPPVYELTGAFRICDLIEKTAEADLATHMFNCTCEVGMCGGFNVGINPLTCSIELCEAMVL